MNRRALSALAIAGVAACTESTQPRMSRRAEADMTSAVNAPVQGGAIAFHSNRAGNFDIWVMNADGSGATQVTNNGGLTFGPRFSPDGARIAFSSNRDGDFEIYLINTDGTGLTQLTHTPRAFEPTWSPDGKRIAFNSNRDGDFHVFVMNADGSGVTQLTHGAGITEAPTAWSPDGRQIAFRSDRTGENELYVMKVDGSGVTQLTTNEGEGDEAGWSPDGKRFVFSSNRDGGRLQIFVMNADGTGVTQLTSGDFEDDDPVWSPNGKKIAFQSTRDGHDEIYVMNADGSGQTRLTFTNAGIDNAVATWRAEPLPVAAACPTTANVVVTNEAGLNAALAAASPGEVIGLGAFFGVTADVIVSTPNVTLTCAAGGAGLFAASPNVVDLIDIFAPNVTLDGLVLDASATQDGPMTATNDLGLTGTAVRVHYTRNTVTCGPGTCAFLVGASRSVVSGNHFTSPGSFTGLQLQAATDPTNTFVIAPIDSIQVKGNTIVATAPSSGPVQGGIRVARGTGVVISGNVVTGPWVNSAGLTTLTGAVVDGNRFEGALVRGIRLSGGNLLLLGALVTRSVFGNNSITGAGVAGIFAFNACNNSFVGNNLQGNGVGIIFPTSSGANTVVGNPGVVVDNGEFDCDGDGVIDPNIIVGAGAILHGVNLGQDVSTAVRQLHGITVQ